MKTKMYLIAFALFSFFAISCDSDELNYKNEFEKSQQEFEKFKIESKNSYKYVVTFGSWVGFSWETTLTIIDGKVTQRYFKQTESKNDKDTIVTEWTEMEDEIGSHENQGAEPLTLDEVYQKAKNVWLINRKGSTTYFKANNNGLISRCGYTQNNCADDCSNGINIKSIEPLFTDAL